MKLYDAAWAPSPRKVRIFLAEKGIAVDRELVDLRRGAHFAPEYLAINPRGMVPALRLDGGEVITDSVAICRYFEALHPEPALFGATPLEIARIENWVRRVEGEGYAAAVYALRNAAAAFKDSGIAGRWPAVPQIPALVERAQTIWAGFTAALDAHLADTVWIAGSQFTFADITALVAVDFAAAARLAVPEGCANIRRWHEAALDRPSASA